MLHLIDRTVKEISDKKRELDIMSSYIGKSIMYKIIYDSTNKRPSVESLLTSTKQRCSKYENAPLLELSINNQEYIMIVDRLDKYVTGEYKSYEDIIRLGELPEDFDILMGELDTIVMKNSVAVYNSLSNDIKKTNKEFICLCRSKTKQFLYFYKDNPKKSFGVIFIEKRVN